jgi:hypothetical protein
LVFMERCGWQRLHECEGMVLYRMTPTGAHEIARVEVHDSSIGPHRSR